MRAAQAGKTALSRSFEAADTDRARGFDWVVRRIATDSALIEDLETLRDRSRDLHRNDQLTHGVVENRVSGIVGKGIRPQARVDYRELKITPEAAREINRQLERVFKRWAPYADQKGVLSFWEIQRQVQRNLDIDGEVFILFGAHGGADKPIPLTMEIIAADRVETPADRKLYEGRTVRLGVEYDGSGRRVGYWVRSYEAPTAYGRRPRRTWRRYAAKFADGRAQVVHLFEQLWPDQSRGIPYVTPAMTRLKDLATWFEAELVAKQTEALFGVFITTEEPQEAAEANASESDSSGFRTEDMHPGQVRYLSPDQSIEFANPNRPGANFDPFMEWTVLLCAAALNWPYEWLVKDYRRSTYSSSRASAIDGMISVRCRQQLISERLLRELWRHVVHMAIGAGAVDVDYRAYDRNPHALLEHHWQGPGRPHVDPVKDGRASAEAIDANLSTLAREVGNATGEDWEELLEQRQREIDYAAELAARSPFSQTVAADAAASDPQTTADVIDSMRAAMRDAVEAIQMENTDEAVPA